MNRLDVSPPALADARADAPVARPGVRGWCPGAHRPMVSGDGLLVRLRPHLARLTVTQALGLCELAQHRGSGHIDLTHRAGLQLRGVTPRDHGAVVDALCRLGLLAADPACEAWPALIVAPVWQAGDETERIACALAARLGELPALPSKFGFAVDAGPAPVLSETPADVRIERAGSGGLIVRADGAAAGQPVTRSAAIDAALALAAWFSATAGSPRAASRRMRRHLAIHALPREFAPIEAPAPPAALPCPGPSALGPVYGVAFGRIEAAALTRLLRASGATALRLTPDRTLILENGRWCEAPEFLTAADDPLLRVDACPGAPACTSATVQTRELARALAPALATLARGTRRGLHVSGCAKGCARARAADITLVGRDGRFDLVRGGRAADAPARTGLSPEDLPALIGAL